MNYVCPMHPEVRQDHPGRCPKCGMELVSEDEVKNAPAKVHGQGVEPTTWKSYLPLIVVIGTILLASLAAAWRQGGVWQDLLTNFMAGFFLVFATFKLMDLKGFAAGYSTYDLFAQRVFAYGYVYPFIELSFGLAMVAGLHAPWLLWAEVVIMLFSGLGVAIKLAKREQFQCVCLGTFLKVPLTKVTLIEDFGMAALALILIFA